MSLWTLVQQLNANAANCSSDSKLKMIDTLVSRFHQCCKAAVKCPGPQVPALSLNSRPQSFQHSMEAFSLLDCEFDGGADLLHERQVFDDYS
jgi:hypothetical protein